MPGVNSTLRPRERALLISRASSVGLATKNRSIGIDVPAVGPLAHVVPDESRRSAGTNTLQFPDASDRRNGRSRVTGLVSSVVYGGGLNGVVENDCGGAPWTPENTWFRTPFDQPPML